MGVFSSNQLSFFWFLNAHQIQLKKSKKTCTYLCIIFFLFLTNYQVLFLGRNFIDHNVLRFLPWFKKFEFFFSFSWVKSKFWTPYHSFWLSKLSFFCSSRLFSNSFLSFKEILRRSLCFNYLHISNRNLQLLVKLFTVDRFPKKITLPKHLIENISWFSEGTFVVSVELFALFHLNSRLKL